MEKTHVSKYKILGLPLVHINTNGVAKGIIAIGRFAFGVVAIAPLSVGIISIGALSFGLLAVAALALGFFTFGGLSLGAFAVGGLALGFYAVGGFALGVHVLGGMALGMYRIVLDPAQLENLAILSHLGEVFIAIGLVAALLLGNHMAKKRRTEQ